MGAAVMSIDGVGKRLDVFVERVVVLEGNFDAGGNINPLLDSAFEIDDFMKSVFIAVEVSNE